MDSRISPKVGGGTIGSAVGFALGEIIIYVLERIPFVGDLPDRIEYAVMILVIAFATFVGGYMPSPRYTGTDKE